MQQLFLRAVGRARNLRRSLQENGKHFAKIPLVRRELSTASALSSEGGPKRAKVKRLGRKKELIEERKQGLALAPLAAADLRSGNAQDYRKVTVTGELLHDKEMLVGPRSAPKDMQSSVLQWGGSSGFLVVTPLRTATGQCVLVNRGWIPQRLADRARRCTAKISPLPVLTDAEWNTIEYGDGVGERSEQVTFTGVLRSSDEKNRFMPENVPEKNEWFYVDVPAMIEAKGLSKDTNPDADPPFIELVEPLPVNGWPYPRDFDHFLEFRTPPSTHVTYATTWFLLSGALALLSRHRIRSSAGRNGKAG